jgi:phospholipid/cholesterol/gamma-HCH transport system substrate-binding protein
MMEFKKNIVVGVFVLIALGALGGMIILFGEAPHALSSSYHVSMYFPSAGPIQNGDSVLVNGVQVGQVDYIAPMEDIRKGVRIVTSILSRYRLPIDAEPIIKSQSVGLSKVAILITVTEKNSNKLLPINGTGELKGTVLEGISELVPKATLTKLEDAGSAITELARSLKPVAGDLHELMKPLSTQAVDAPTTGPAQPMANLSTAIQRLDSTLKNFNTILADPNNQQNITAMIKNFRTVSEQGVSLAKELRQLTGHTDARIEKLTSSIVQSTDKLNFLLDSLHEASNKIANGQGSAGRFLNDPELYEALTFSAKRLTLAIDDLHQLLQQWQEKGLKVQGGLLSK